MSLIILQLHFYRSLCFLHLITLFSWVYQVWSVTMLTVKTVRRKALCFFVLLRLDEMMWIQQWEKYWDSSLRWSRIRWYVIRRMCHWRETGGCFFFLKVSGNLKSMHDSCKSNIPVQCLSRVEKVSKTFTKARLCIHKKSWWREISHIIGKIYFTTESNSHRLIKHGLQIN